MKFLKLLLTSGTFYALYTVCVYLINFVESNATHLPNYIIPKHYDIYLHQATVGNEFFVGNCQVLIQIDRPTQNIYLHAQSPQIKILRFVLNNVNSSSIHIPKNYTYNNESHIIDLYFIDILSIANYILKMVFITYLDNTGEGVFNTTYTNREGEKISLVATLFQATGARRMFPCWDEIMFKATFNITIKHFYDYIPLSNMPIRNIKMQKEKMILTSFKETPIISIYNVAIILSQLVDISYFNKNTWYHPSQLPYIIFAQNFSNDVMQHMKSKWKNFNITTLNHVVIPNFPYESMEYLRLVLYREAAITYNEKSDPIMCKINVARIVTRAMIYQWVTNLVIPSQWSYAWINQGISSLLAADVIDKIYPQSRMSDLFAVQIRQESLLLDTDSIIKPLTSANTISEINSLFSFSYYIKAPAILCMLQSLLTNEVFWNGIKIFLNKPSANSMYLWTAMQTALDESLNIEKFDIEKMNPWTQLEHYPVLEVIGHDYQYSMITLENYDLSKYKTSWIPTTQIPITSKSTHVWSHEPIVWYNLSHSTIYKEGIAYFRFDNINKIINLKQGYYRIKYYGEYWMKIAEQLNTEYRNIHLLSRAQIIDDAFYFLMKNELHLSEFLKVVEHLQNETDYIAWYPMIKALEYMSCFIPLDESTHIKIQMRNMLSILLDKIGYTEKISDNDLQKCLRQEIVKWACNLGDHICNENALHKLKMHLNAPAENKLSPWWKKWTFCNGLMASDSNSTWWSVFDIWTKTSNNIFLEFLSCSVSPYIVRNYLNIIANTSNCSFNVSKCKDANIPINERINSFLLIVAKNARNSMILQYILNNFDKLKPREISATVTLIVIINNIYSEESFNQVKKFVKDYKEKEMIDINYKFLPQKLNKEINNYVKMILKELTSSIQIKIDLRKIGNMKNKYNFYNLWRDKLWKNKNINKT